MAVPSGIFSILKSYKGLIALLIGFAFLSNGLNLLLPKIIANGIDSFTHHHFSFQTIVIQFSVASLLVFVFTYLQSIVQTYTSERVAYDMRTTLAGKISGYDYAGIEKENPSKLLTNLTADTDSIKAFVSQAVVSIASSAFTIIGASILLLSINWKLGLSVMAIIPVIGTTFFMVLKKVRALFIKSRTIIDRLNKVINESILGAALIRVVHSQHLEYDKFLDANSQAKNLGLSILRLFATLIPVIVFTSNMAALTILAMGGHLVITGTMSLGNFTAFNSYLAMLIFPILIIGFMSNIIAQATAAYQRIGSVLNAEEVNDRGTVQNVMKGDIDVQNISLSYGQKPVLKQVSFRCEAGSRIAIIGPTAAGKTQLLYIMAGMVKPNSGMVAFDGHTVDDWRKEDFYKQVSLVFQDSIIFNMSVRENIAFSGQAAGESLTRAIETAELQDLVRNLPQGLDTVVSERGSSLSGGQKQRIMLARALSVNPKVLLLDDFTARVDQDTEKKILVNVKRNYPDLTLVSVTQKIAAVEQYDQIILLADGEIIASGKHEELMKSSAEYVQIFNSQQTTSNYELRP